MKGIGLEDVNTFEELISWIKNHDSSLSKVLLKYSSVLEKLFHSEKDEAKWDKAKTKNLELVEYILNMPLTHRINNNKTAQRKTLVEASESIIAQLNKLEKIVNKNSSKFEFGCDWDVSNLGKSEVNFKALSACIGQYKEKLSGVSTYLTDEKYKLTEQSYTGRNQKPDTTKEITRILNGKIEEITKSKIAYKDKFISAIVFHLTGKEATPNSLKVRRKSKQVSI